MAGGTSLGRLYVDLLMNTGSFETDAGRAARIAEKRAKEIDRSIAKLSSAITGKFAAAGAAVAGFVFSLQAAEAVAGRVKEAIDYADKLDELSARLDKSTEKLSGWAYAAKLSGVDLETLASAIPKLSKQVAAGGEIWDALGIKTKDATGKLRDVEDLLPEIADRFAALNDSTLEQALAQELFGKSGAVMLEFLNRGSAGIKALETDLASLGGVIDGKTASQAAAFNDELDKMEIASTALTLRLTAHLLPTAVKLTEDLNSLAREGGAVEGIAWAMSEAFDAVERRAKAAAAVIQITTSAIIGTAEAAKAVTQLSPLGGFNRAGAGDSLRNAGVAFNMIPDVLRGNPTPSGPDPIFITPDSGSIPESARTPAWMRQFEQMQDRIAKLLAGGGKGGKGGARKAQLSEEAKAAQELARRYADVEQRMQERIATAKEEATLGHKVGEAWKTAYDLQFGELAKLNPEQKANLQAMAEQIDQLEKQAAAAQKAIEAKQAAGDIVRQIDLEREALGLTNHELAVREALLRANVPAGSEFAAGIEASVTALEKAQKQMAALDGVRDVAREFLYDLPNGAADAWGKALDAIEARLWQWAANGVLDQLLGPHGTDGTGNTGGLLGGVLGSIFGGGTNTAGGIFASIFGGGRASGGPVMGGKLYDVTEKGLPELLDFKGRQMLMMPPGAGGHVTAMRAGRGGGMTMVVNHNYAAPFDSRTADQMAFKTQQAGRRALARNS